MPGSIFEGGGVFGLFGSAGRFSSMEGGGDGMMSADNPGETQRKKIQAICKEMNIRSSLPQHSAERSTLITNNKKY